jgi:vitamin B12 transporter
MIARWLGASAILIQAGGIFTTAAAQEVQDTQRLRELVVTATRMPTAPDAVVSSITSISGDELRRRGVRFVHDALREVPGATVVQVGSYGAVSSLFLRGGESDYVKVLVDGVPVNQAGGSYNWANLTTDNIDRIEVLRGPASVIYGSDAVTGVVQVFTRRGAPGFAVEGGGEGGSFGTVAGHAGVLGGTDRVNYSANVSHIGTDGTYAFNNEYRNTVISGSLHGTPDSRTDASVAVRFADNVHHFPTDGSGILSDSNQSNTEQALSLAVDVGRRLGDRYQLRLTGGGSRIDGGFEDQPDHPGDTLGFGFASHRSSRAERGNLDLRVNAWPSSVLTLTAGSQIERETERQSGETTSNFGGIATTPDTPFDQGRTTVGYYTQGVLDLPSGLAVNLNARVDHNSGFGTFFTYRAGMAYRLPWRTRLRASVGRAFKAPTFCEQFCDAPFVVGDSGLRPERSTSWEVGVEQEVAANRVSVWATYFNQDFRDMVLYDGGAAPGSPTYFNGASAWARGVEAGFKASVTAGLRTSFSYSYLASKATEDGGMPSAPFASGERLIRRPRHSAELAVTALVQSRAMLTGSLTYVGSRDDVDFSQFPSRRVELPGYALVDLAADVEILRPGVGRPSISAIIRVENLFEEEYDQVVGFPGRPRGVFGGARFRF